MKKLLIILIVGSLFAREYIAVIDFEGIGVNQQEARSLTQRLTSEMIKLEIYQVLERAAMKKLLTEQKFQSSGCVSTQCAVDIGKMLGAKYMIVGSVNKVGRTFSIDARMIDVETSESYISANYDYTGEIDLLLKQGMTNIAYQLCEMDISNLPVINSERNLQTDRKYYQNNMNKNSNNWNRVNQSIIILPIIAKCKYNQNGDIIGASGWSGLLGYYSKNYYKPLKTNSWNTFWHWGTFALIYPYFGLGMEHINNNGFIYGIGTIYHIPYISIGKYF